LANVYAMLYNVQNKTTTTGRTKPRSDGVGHMRNTTRISVRAACFINKTGKEREKAPNQTNRAWGRIFLRKGWKWKARKKRKIYMNMNSRRRAAGSLIKPVGFFNRYLKDLYTRPN
jgi:hypothetical protein